MATKVTDSVDLSHMDNRVEMGVGTPDIITPRKKLIESKRVEFTDDMMMELYENGLRDAGGQSGNPPRKTKRGTSGLLESQDTGSDLSEDILMELLESVERLNKRFSRIEKYLFDE